MYYIKNGLEKKYHFLAYAFAFFGMIAAFGIGNGVQSNSVAQVVSMELNISQVTVGFYNCNPSYVGNPWWYQKYWENSR